MNRIQYFLEVPLSKFYLNWEKQQIKKYFLLLKVAKMPEDIKATQNTNDSSSSMN
jgi:hypothetical protein